MGGTVLACSSLALPDGRSPDLGVTENSVGRRRHKPLQVSGFAAQLSDALNFGGVPDYVGRALHGSSHEEAVSDVAFASACEIAGETAEHDSVTFHRPPVTTASQISCGSANVRSSRPAHELRGDDRV